MTVYLFDVDGTLTPSRGEIDADFLHEIMLWCAGKKVYLVTGSDYQKTFEQVGALCLAVTGVFNCAGNAYYEKGELVYQNDFLLTQEQKQFLTELMDASPFPLRTGIHIEERIGLTNFSVVGRGATKEQRKQYHLFDLETKERYNISRQFTERFPELEATVAGETGIDIYPVGRDKAQVLDKLTGPFVFFGDRTEVGGNDHTIYKALTANRNNVGWRVNDWRNTQTILRTSYSDSSTAW